MIKHPAVLFGYVLLLSSILWASSVRADDDREVRNDREVVLVLGDSISAGYGIPQGKDWMTLLQTKLDNLGVPLRLVNASISGDTTAGGRARLAPLLRDEKPDWLIIELGGNDGLRGMSLTAMEANLQALVEMAQQNGVAPMLVAMKIPPNYGRRYVEKFEAVYGRVAETNNIPLLPFILDGVAGNSALMQEDRIHPNVTAQPIIVDTMWSVLEAYVLQSTSASAQ